MQGRSTVSDVAVLTPAHAWRLIANDPNAEIWITVESADDIARFESSLAMPASASSADVIRALRETDHGAFIVFNKRERTLIAECRPRAGDRFYVSRDADTFEIASGLEHSPVLLRSGKLSSRFVAIWLANALTFGSFDLFLGCSPFEGVDLVTRGVRATLVPSTGTGTISLITEASGDCPLATPNLQKAIDECRFALSNSIATAAKDSDVVAECSGGIDSGLTAVFAKRTVGSRFQGGIFAAHPYYEFRKERHFAECIASSAGFKLFQSSPQLSMCWGALHDSRMATMFSEPSLDLPFWGQALAACDAAQECSSPAVLTGQGGDLLFEEQSLSYSFGAQPAWMRKAQWDILTEETDRIYKWVQSPAGAASGLCFDNPWMSRCLGKLHPNALYYSPLSSRSVIASVSNVRRHLQQNPRAKPLGKQKPVAYAIFAEFLPEQIWNRRWKVNYVGLYYRFWLHFGLKCVELATRMRPYLEALGFRSHAIIRSMRRMASGQQSSDRLLNGIVTYLLWLEHFLAQNALIVRC